MDALYADAPITVRPDLATAHAETLISWSRPGNAWNATQRLAIVAEVRAARSIDPTPPPWARVSDRRQAASLPPVAVDVTWRLANHPGTTTADWYDDVLARGLTEPQYVELVGLVATTCALDVFAESLGLVHRPLRGAEPGDADGRHPAAEVSTHWVPTTPGFGPMVGLALTLSPVAERDWVRLSEAQYVPHDALLGDLGYTRGALDRMQVELLAARTSRRNECFY